MGTRRNNACPRARTASQIQNPYQEYKLRRSAIPCGLLAHPPKAIRNTGMISNKTAITYNATVTIAQRFMNPPLDRASESDTLTYGVAFRHEHRVSCRWAEE